LELLADERLPLRIEPLPGVEVDGHYVDAPSERHRIDRFRDLVPTGRVAGQAARHAAVHYPGAERRHDFGERHADRGGADAAEEIAHRVVEHADLLALEVGR